MGEDEFPQIVIGEEIKKRYKLSNDQWEKEPTITFLITYVRLTVEQMLEYCIERANHYNNIEELKQDLKRKAEALHKKNMQIIDDNLNKLLFD